MALSNELISQFVKATNDNDGKTTDNTAYGTIVIYNGEQYVRLDGSDLLTPISSTTVVGEGDRVLVTIKNHTATVTGSTTSPSANNRDVVEIGNKISEFEIIVADKVSTAELDAQSARIDDLVTDNVTIKERLVATEADIDTLTADNVTINEKLTAAEADIESLETKKLNATDADIKYATIESLEVTNADIHNLEADYGDFVKLSTSKFEANEASITDLQTNKLSATDADLKYANIDFANINQAAIEKVFSDSGIIRDLVVSEGKITGELVGVTIKGDIIEGGTVKADKLVVKGSDGLFYKLNTDGVDITAEQTEYNSLSGSVITAKSITAEKVAVDDLVAFDATIGGFTITEESLYSGVKSSVDNTTRGVYLDKTGQMAIGDANNYLKYFLDTDGSWKLAISAQSLVFSASNKNLEDTITDLEANSIVSTIEEFYQSTSPVSLNGGTWSTAQPTWVDGKYIWRRTAVTYGDGSSEYTPSSTGVCITGNTGAKGNPGIPGTQGLNLIGKYSTSAVNATFDPKTGTMTSTTTTNTVNGSIQLIFIIRDGSTATVWSTATIGRQKHVFTVPRDFVTMRFKITGNTREAMLASNNKLREKLAPGDTCTISCNVESLSSDGAGNGGVISGIKLEKGVAIDPIWTPAIEDLEGAPGKGIKSTAITYQAGTSGTTVPTGTWSANIPSVAKGQYLWSRTIITYTDDTTSTTYSVAYIPMNGAAGATGTGVQSITQQYYLSTSKTSQTGGSWGTSMPTWSIGTYLWTRYAITYKNPTSTVYTSPICDSSWEAVNEIQVGGRNLYIISNSSEGYLVTNAETLAPMDGIRLEHTSEFIPVQSGDEYIFQVWVTIDAADTNDPNLWMAYDFFDSNKAPIGNRPAKRINTTLPDGKSYGVYHIIIPASASYLRVSARFYSDGQVKLEKGNKATDWAPAPEDVDEDINNAQTSADEAQNTASNAAERVATAELNIDALTNTISSLVVDDNGASLMTQTSDGWVFSFGETLSRLNQAVEDLDNLNGDVETANGNIESLSNAVNALQELGNYVKITTQGNQPCLELGNLGEFKVRITNTEIQFIQGSTVVAHISNEELHISRADVDNELAFGNFVLTSRQNGNAGFVWKGGS